VTDHGDVGIARSGRCEVRSAPMSYRVIAKLRHRKLSAIGLYTVLSLRHFRLARWCSLSLREAAPKTSPKARARRISTGRLTRTRRLVGAAAADRRWCRW
jgi:hypothetical protein